MSVKSNTNKAHAVKQQLKQPDSMSVDSRRCHQNSLKYLTLFVPHITNCVFLKGWSNAQRFERTTINIAINIEVPSSIIQATNSVPGSFVLLCRPCAASMISKSSSSWKFEMGTPTRLIWEQKYIRNDI